MVINERTAEKIFGGRKKFRAIDRYRYRIECKATERDHWGNWIYECSVARDRHDVVELNMPDDPSEYLRTPPSRWLAMHRLVAPDFVTVERHRVVMEFVGPDSVTADEINYHWGSHVSGWLEYALSLRAIEGGKAYADKVHKLVTILIARLL